MDLCVCVRAHTYSANIRKALRTEQRRDEWGAGGRTLLNVILYLTCVSWLFVRDCKMCASVRVCLVSVRRYSHTHTHTSRPHGLIWFQNTTMCECVYALPGNVIEFERDSVDVCVCECLQCAGINDWQLAPVTVLFLCHTGLPNIYTFNSLKCTHTNTRTHI